MNNFKTKKISDLLEDKFNIKDIENKKDYILIWSIIWLILIFGILIWRFTKVEAKTDYEINNQKIVTLIEANKNTIKNIQKLSELEELQTKTIECMKNKREALEAKEKVVNDCINLINKLYKNDNIK